MAVGIQEIRQWFTDGVSIGATHMIVVCDTYDWEDYPVYVHQGEDVRKIEAKHSLRAGNMQKVMEVYDLRMDKEDQINSGMDSTGLLRKKVFNY
jgi:hypothetical protein